MDFMPTREQTRRVLIVTPQPFYEDRGTPIAVRYVANALSEIGVQVDLLAFPVGQDLEISNLSISRCANPLRLRHVPIGFSWRKIVLDTSLWWSFARLLSAQRYDMVHAVEEAAYMAAALCPRFKQPFMYDMASSIPTELQRKPLFRSALVQRMLMAAERRVLKSASRVVCSAGLADYVRAQAPEARVSDWRFPSYSTQVAPAEVDALREELVINEEQRILLYSGNFAGYQGVEMLIEAFTQARENFPDLVLVCVGATEREVAAWSKRPSAPIDDYVRIVPRQPREQISVYIELADFLMMPRLGGDNIPLKLYDYMASGKPIIATRQMADMPLLNDTRAFLCDPTVESLAATMTRACGSPREAAALARESQRYARRHFGWSPFVEFVNDTYRRAIEEAPQADDDLAA